MFYSVKFCGITKGCGTELRKGGIKGHKGFLLE